MSAAVTHAARIEEHKVIKAISRVSVHMLPPDLPPAPIAVCAPEPRQPRRWRWPRWRIEAHAEAVKCATLTEAQRRQLSLGGSGFGLAAAFIAVGKMPYEPPPALPKSLDDRVTAAALRLSGIAPVQRITLAQEQAAKRWFMASHPEDYNSYGDWDAPHDDWDDLEVYF